MQEQRVPLIDVQLVLEMLCREPNAERQAAYSELIKARNAFRDTGTTDRWARCVQTARQYEGLTPAIIWVRLKTFLKSYFYKFSIARLVGRVTGREPTPGVYLCSVLVLLVASGFGATYWKPDQFFSLWLIPLAIVYLLAVLYVIDALLVHTTIAYLTRDPDDPLRSMLLSFFALTNIVLAFAVIYAAHGHHFRIPVDEKQSVVLTFPPSVARTQSVVLTLGEKKTVSLGYPRSAFFSAATATTFGDAPIEFDGGVAQTIVGLQLLTTLYFLAVIIAIISGWAPPSKRE